ncbi:MAG: pirin family protein [Pasteurellaceae bacterium]|nr:pirin family protein [Pasteurellaceae bacterium]
MLQKINGPALQGGVFNVLYPNGQANDSGLGSIGRIAHTFVNQDLLVPMHTHQNDEILSYFRSGTVHHTDSENISDTIHSTRLMLMKAGKFYQHEERILGRDQMMQGLQIFIRPRIPDGRPSVQFRDLTTEHSENQWRLLASHLPDSELQFTSETWVYDIRLQTGKTLTLPDFNPQLTYLLYVFNGEVNVNQYNLSQRDSLIIRGEEDVQIKTDNQAELVLFVTNEQGEIFKGGMFSGNRY